MSVQHRSLCRVESLREHQADFAGPEAAQGRRVGSLTEVQERSADKKYPHRRPDVIARGAGFGAKLQLRRQQLCGQACGFSPIHRSRAAAGPVLGVAQSSAVGTVCSF